MIQETTNSYQLFMISQKVSDIRGVDYTPMDFLKYLIDGQERGITKVFVDMDKGGKMNGFIVATIVKPMEKAEIFIDLAEVDPNMNGLGLDLQTKIEGWARELKISKISMATVRNEAAYKKKYGFKRDHIIMSKTLTEEAKDEQCIQTEGDGDRVQDSASDRPAKGGKRVPTKATSATVPAVHGPKGSAPKLD